MTAVPDLPSRAETVVAYAAATLASLVWVGTVLPGVRLSPPGMADDESAPMVRASFLLIPALLLLVAGPVTTLLARGFAGMRSLLAAGTAFVALYSGGSFAASGSKDPVMLVAAGVLLAIGLLAVRDVVAVLRQAPVVAEDSAAEAAAEGATPKPAPSVDLRLALSLLALLAPAWFVAQAGGARGSLMAPFVYLTASALGERFALRPAALRFTAAVLMALLAAHTFAALRWALARDGEGMDRWTWCGWTTLALSVAVFGANVLWAFLIMRRRTEDEATGEPTGEASGGVSGKVTP